MRQIMLGLRDLSLIGPDPAEDPGALIREGLDNKELGHATIEPNTELSIQPDNWCVCYLRG